MPDVNGAFTVTAHPPVMVPRNRDEVPCTFEEAGADTKSCSFSSKSHDSMVDHNVGFSYQIMSQPSQPKYNVS